MIHRALVTALVMCAFACVTQAQRTIRISVDPSLKVPLVAIAGEFKKVHKDVKVEFVSAAKATVVLGPTSSSGSKRLFALDKIAVVAPAEPKRVLKFAHLGLNLKFALLKPGTREGRLVTQIMDQARTAYGLDWWTNTKRNSTVAAASSAEAVKLVLDGKVDAAVALSSDAALASSKLRLIPIPPDMARAVEHFAIVKGGSLERAFVEFLYTKGNQQRLVAAGFSSPISPIAELTITMPGSMMKLFTSAFGTYKQETVRAANEEGMPVSFTGASLRSILGKARGHITFFSADGERLSVPMSSIRRSGGVLAAMGDGNYRVVLPGGSARRTLRWVRRIEVQ